MEDALSRSKEADSQADCQHSEAIDAIRKVIRGTEDHAQKELIHGPQHAREMQLMTGHNRENQLRTSGNF